MKGVVAIITHELLVRILLAPTQAAGTLMAGLAWVILAFIAERLVLPWTQQLGSAWQGQAEKQEAHPTPKGEDRGQNQNSLFTGFSTMGAPSPGRSILKTSSTNMIRQLLREPLL